MTLINIFYDQEWAEFLVPEKSGEIYHTPDHDDALDTAMLIWGDDVEINWSTKP